MKKIKLTKAQYMEWQASLFGATLIAGGIGVLFENVLRPIALYAIIVGIVLHGWGMYKINKRNKH